jgi:hypothetical protein
VSARQQVLMLWLASPSLDSRVLGWSFFDGTGGVGPQLQADPPYGTGVAALLDGWRLLQMSPLIPPMPGHERDTSFLKHEFLFERLVDVDGGALPDASTLSSSDHVPTRPA